MPRNRIVSDTRKVVFCYRASPDWQRILFGGRVSVSEAVRCCTPTWSRFFRNLARRASVIHGADSSAFDGLKFESRPFYTGTPWFLAPSIRYYRWRDRPPS